MELELVLTGCSVAVKKKNKATYDLSMRQLITAWFDFVLEF